MLPSIRLITALAVAGLLLVAPPARAATWPNAYGGGATLVELTLPAGALPPGPAVARTAARGGLAHTLRFAVPVSGDTDLRLWTAWDLSLASSGQSGVQVVVESEVGGSWTTSVDPFGWEAPIQGNAGSPQFAGTSEQLAAFTRGIASAATSPTLAERATSGLQLLSTHPAPACRWLASAPYVVADARGQADHYLACAARGARIVLVTSAPPPGIAFVEPGAVVLWGRGRLAWAPDFDRYAGGAALALADETRQAGASWADFLGQPGVGDAGTDRRPGLAAIVALLVVYVLVIGPVGWLVGVRPRRVLVTWGWFPAVAALATAGALVVALLWRDDPSLTVTRTTVVSPGGRGLRQVQLALDAPYGRAWALQTPWRDADLSQFWSGQRFGGPFGKPIGPLRIAQDQIARRARIEGLASSSWGDGALGWVEVAEQRDLRVEASADGLVLVNGGARPITRGLAVWEGRLQRVADLGAGDRVALAFDEPLGAGDWQVDVADWLDLARGQLAATPPEPGSFGVLVEYAMAEDTELTVEPALRVQVTDVVVLAGPAPRWEAP